LSFSLRTPRPPTSPLFPYTTLFRSALGTVLVAEGINGFYGPKGRLTQALLALGLAEPTRLTHNYTGVMLALFVQHFPFCFLMLLDRKSTRLNSSHVAISYAVFCLKK